MSTVYGPYERDDGRKHVIIYNFNKGIRRTVSYPKYLMEQRLGRKLKPNETVHHKNEDFSDDSPENLEVKTRADHSRLHAIKYSEFKIVKCKVCGKKYKLNRTQQSDHFRNRNRNRSKGYFCSKSCIGKYGKLKQMESGRIPTGWRRGT